MTDARQKLSECNGLGQMFARFVFVLALSIGLFRGMNALMSKASRALLKCCRPSWSLGQRRPLNKAKPKIPAALFGPCRLA
jgi:hypothetical protein